MNVTTPILPRRGPPSVSAATSGSTTSLPDLLTIHHFHSGIQIVNPHAPLQGHAKLRTDSRLSGIRPVSALVAAGRVEVGSHTVPANRDGARRRPADPLRAFVLQVPCHFADKQKNPGGLVPPGWHWHSLPNHRSRLRLLWSRSGGWSLFRGLGLGFFLGGLRSGFFFGGLLSHLLFRFLGGRRSRRLFRDRLLRGGRYRRIGGRRGGRIVSRRRRRWWGRRAACHHNQAYHRQSENQHYLSLHNPSLLPKNRETFANQRTALSPPSAKSKRQVQA